MMISRFVAVASTALIVTLAGCSGAYQNSIQGSYNTAYKRGGEAKSAGDYKLAAKEYAFAARSGHPKALLAYGGLFEKGYGVDRDPVRAAELFEEAHDKQSGVDAKAALELGKLLLKGGDGPSGTLDKDEERARTLLQKAFDGGEARAAYSLGKIYEGGLGVDPDPARAISYYEQAPDDDSNSSRKLAALRIDAGASKDDVTEVTERTINRLEERAQGGYDRAWYDLADIFAKGKIVDADLTRAVGYLERLPADTDAAMTKRVDKLYKRIDDLKKQRQRDRLAADAGSPEAQTELARLFLEPGTADTNGVVGRYYALRAIGQNSTDAMYYLGKALVHGDVLDPEPLAGETLLRRASEDGHAEATLALGRFILAGDLRSRRPDEGRELLEQAAAEGSADAMRELGFAYHLGLGLPQDPGLALEWLKRAADAGDGDAIEFLDERQEA